MIIRIPTPGTGGYIHPGDALVILSGIILGPLYGFLAAGLGSCLSDFLGGYFFYVPATFLIKGLVALLTALACQRLQHLPKGRTASVICGGVIDALFMRIADVCLAFPGIVFALALAAVIDGGIWGAVLALAAVSWPKYARLARSQTLTLLGADFIAAARLAGNTTAGLVWRHILPNIGGQILVTAVLDIGTMMMELAALSFLGLGAEPPTAEWGSMMSAGRSLLWVYPWVVLTPGIGIFVAVALFNLFSDALRDALDPRDRGTLR